ncbi:phosphoglucomutase/phosphomannomutase PgmG [Rhodovibrio salinarum]|uniref:Phosphomannomutase/phosphoglucomutase n=1 Tax=Rhodovibrio salinarum TaxID=1087 RepID=A0A934QG00_9PROT|nr:phosphomannomutase/phosphoglucomutase [Rhodovibrio salinarum]MBK1696154.1 phosphomannomutase/phosphoglucomutase [Rhodovibrio salinarum]
MAEARTLDPSLLREYDVRGIVGETLFADDAYALGRAFARVVADRGGSRIAVGYDGRISSPELADAFASALVDSGMTVLEVGLGPTPLLYYATKVRGADAGVQITGSHNPPEYNGLKFMLNGEPFFGKDIAELGEIAGRGDFVDGTGAREWIAVMPEYVEALARELDLASNIRVAWDPGNGAAGAATQMLKKIAPGQHTLINAEVDGRFPNHHPDPSKVENLEQLQQAVRQGQCDLGVAFDGDGDRIGVVDEEGEVLWPDELMILFARDMPGVGNKAPIVADVKASKLLFDKIAETGGEPIMWKTGHSLIKAKMAETGAQLAGEMSGHVFINDRWYGFDDALYAACRLLRIVAARNISLAEFRRNLPEIFNTPEIRFECPPDRKFEVAGEIEQRLADDPDSEVITVDGVRVNTPQGWWLLRASNTQDMLVARCEAYDAEGLEQLKEQLADQLALSNLKIPAEIEPAAQALTTSQGT